MVTQGIDRHVVISVWNALNRNNYMIVSNFVERYTKIDYWVSDIQGLSENHDNNCIDYFGFP